MVTGNGDKIFHLGAYSLQSWTVDRRLSHPLSFLSNTQLAFLPGLVESGEPPLNDGGLVCCDVRGSATPD